MIRNIRHKGLEWFFREGDTRGISAQHLRKLSILLTALNAASRPDEMNLPGARLHPLKGERAGQWAVSVSGNWRLVFEFVGEDSVNVDFIDYH